MTHRNEESWTQTSRTSHGRPRILKAHTYLKRFELYVWMNHDVHNWRAMDTRTKHESWMTQDSRSAYELEAFRDIHMSHDTHNWRVRDTYITYESWMTQDSRSAYELEALRISLNIAFISSPSSTPPPPPPSPYIDVTWDICDCWDPGSPCSLGTNCSEYRTVSVMALLIAVLIWFVCTHVHKHTYAHTHTHTHAHTHAHTYTYAHTHTRTYPYIYMYVYTYTWSAF